MVERPLMVRWVVGSLHRGGPNCWCNEGRGMCYPVCGVLHIKEPLLLIERLAHVFAEAGFLSEYLSGPLPYIRRCRHCGYVI